MAFGFGKKEEPPLLPLSGPPSPSTDAPLEEVVVQGNAVPLNKPVITGATATATRMPTSTVGAATLIRGIPPPVAVTARRGEYVALGGSRKSGKGRKGKGKGKKSKKAKKAKKSRKGKKSKSSKSRN